MTPAITPAIKGCAVILAAGLGTRMKSALPKLLHPVLGTPLIMRVASAVLAMEAIAKRVIVISPQAEAVKDVFIHEFRNEETLFAFAYQDQPLGTAHALQAGLCQVDDSFDYVIVLAGDTPLVKTATLNGLIETHLKEGNDLTVLSFIAQNPASYGRIVRNADGLGERIVEDKDATEKEKAISEVNSGVYVMGRAALACVHLIEMNEKKKEYYLTDIVAICRGRKGLKTGILCSGKEEEFRGVNTRLDLLQAQRSLQQEILLGWMEEGVSFLDDRSVIIHPEVEIGRDTVIHPGVTIEGKTVIGQGCTIHSGVRIADCVLEEGVVVKDNTLVERSMVRAHSSLGPFAHIRPGSDLGPKAKIGNFVEIKNSTVGYNTKASHLSYIGDAFLGANINIGAGTITCNYDGKNKHRTVIEDGVFIGSDSQLIAPVTVHANAFVAAGSTITKDVPADALALSRTKQNNIPLGAAKVAPKGVSKD